MCWRISVEEIQSYGAKDDIIKMALDVVSQAHVHITSSYTKGEKKKRARERFTHPNRTRKRDTFSSVGESHEGQKDLGVGSRGLTTQQLLAFVQPDGAIICLFLEEQR